MPIKKGHRTPVEKDITPAWAKRTPSAWVWKLSSGLRGHFDPDFGSEHPHADMLRYDLAFCNPEHPEQIVFPVFKTPDGRTTQKITLDRWHSFGISLERLTVMRPEDVLSWITYITNGIDDLLPVKMSDYMERHKAKVITWR